MFSHFCPSCGQGIQARWGSRRVQCSRCSGQAVHSGPLLMICGLTVALVGGFTSAYLVAAVSGLGFSIVGAIRLFRQLRAARDYATRYPSA